MNKMQVRKAMLEDLARSGLTTEDAKKLQISTTAHSLTPSKSAYTIPYFDVNGKKTKFYRIRYVETTTTGFDVLSGRKPLRYNQPPRTVNEVYFPPFANWRTYLAGKHPLVITEGEKKSAVATREGVHTIGLGGVWCFTSRKSEMLLLPALEAIDMEGRVVFICFDSDAAANPNIVAAENTLATRLLAKGAQVMITRIPHEDGKVGIDDYILRYGSGQFQQDVLGTAHEYAESQVLHEMNEHLVYIRKQGSIYDHTFNMNISPASFVQSAYANKHVHTWTREATPRLVAKPAAPLWLQWPHRAELLSVTYAPGKPRITESLELNTWNGWGVKKSEKGDVSLWHELLDILFPNKATDAGTRKWFEQWVAYPIQHPGTKLFAAVLFWGIGTGTGKTLLGHTIMSLYGDNGKELKDAELEDPRNMWAAKKQFVLADDITGHDNRKLANRLKTLITQKTMTIRNLYEQPYDTPDCINYMFTSNSPDAFFLEDQDRRYFIHNVENAPLEYLPNNFVERYMAWKNSDEGRAALFYYLQTLDVAGFNPSGRAPETVAKKEMLRAGKSDVGDFVQRLLEDPIGVLKKQPYSLLEVDALYSIYCNGGTKQASAISLSKELVRAGFRKLQNPGGGGIRIGDRQLRLYAVKDRERWEAASVKEIVEQYIKERKLKF